MAVYLGSNKVAGSGTNADVSFARVSKTDTVSLTSETTLQNLTRISEMGDYVCDTTNHRIIIKNTTLVQVSGKICGNGYASIFTKLIEAETGNHIIAGGERRTIVQFAGNNYWSIGLPTITVELDPSKTYYLSLSASPYNTDSFHLNSGFEGNSTWFSALKIK